MRWAFLFPKVAPLSCCNARAETTTEQRATDPEHLTHTPSPPTMAAVCLVCLCDDDRLLRVCDEDHVVCTSCAGGVARKFAENPTKGVDCPAGRGGACRGRACQNLLVIALAAGGESSKDDIAVLLTALTSAEVGPAEQRGRAEGAEAARKEVSDMSEVDNAVRRIRDEILTERCPGCNQAFDDYDGCNAVKCDSCGCGFCAVCLEVCGTDAHGHGNP